jgi:SAM-dependent methyltransferase
VTKGWNFLIATISTSPCATSEEDKMNKGFLNILCDPYTFESLSIECEVQVGDNVISGYLISKSNRFPIIHGVPRFNINENSASYTKSFGYQWNKWPYIQFEGENTNKPMQGHTTQMFERITEISLRENDLENKFICDIGCGSGRFIDLLSKSSNFLIGIDSSESVYAASKRFGYNPRVLICQADVLHLPLKKNSVDHVYSIGVLHHTEDPKKGVKEISRILKQNGTASISVYGKGGYYDDQIVRFYRRLFAHSWRFFGPHLPLLYSRVIVTITRPLERFARLKILLKPILMYIPHIQLPDFKWSILDTFDSITPSYQKGISYFELFSYMSEYELFNIKAVNWGGTSLKGTRGEISPGS